jgi:trypsin
VGGSPVTIPQYESFGKLDLAGSGLCGATLIYEDIMLSAAHCDGAFTDYKFFAFHPPVVRIGAKRFDGNDAIDTVEIAAILPHPDYRSAEKGDIMLIKLKRPSTAPIAKWNDDSSVPEDGETLMAIGFGQIAANKGLPDNLLQTDVQVYGYEKCRAKHEEAEDECRRTLFPPNLCRRDDSVSDFADENFICTGTLEGGKSTCSGDSGGPLFDRNGTIVGVTSWRKDGPCGLADLPSFKTRVSNYADFIRESICQLSENPPADCPNVTEGACSGIFRCDRLFGRRSGYVMHRNVLGRCFDTCVTTSWFQDLLECGPCGTNV